MKRQPSKTGHGLSARNHSENLLSGHYYGVYLNKTSPEAFEKKFERIIQKNGYIKLKKK
jgi:hypothetical protein